MCESTSVLRQLDIIALPDRLRMPTLPWLRFWPTVENLLTLPNGGRRYYLVQDYEPSFYPDEAGHYARAENTYRAGLHCITLGPWLAEPAARALPRNG